ncbi:MAG: ATP-binding protein [Ignavibacteria bacterium]|nr:ATP-binding protein [Ignavibacteria bacterium]
MNITIPTRLLNLIQGVTDEVSASVSSSISSVTPILLRNEAPFFPDYTDHGIQHINSVLQTCELLISEDSWSVFTREDAAVIILAIISHDLGMLITTETFTALVHQNNTKTVAPDDIVWNKIWHEFKLAACRFDGATLTNITGSPEPVNLEELNSDNFTERGRKLAGEFLRLHHHRLSHEILVLGLPSEQGLVHFFKGVPEHFKEFAGIIARSHGMSIRKCIESITSLDNTSFREYRHIHITFLMTLIRLADYLDLDYNRAPSSILSAKSLKSPISRREWWAHKALVDLHSNAEDPECLQVLVESKEIPNISTYLTIEQKIEGVQKELDNCWAIIGEVYGRFPPLNRLALKIRRIKSNIRNKNIVSQLPFIPQNAFLRSSKSELLKLLIAPLYGNKPEIGIRELLQNSVDAVRELKYLARNNKGSIIDLDEKTEWKVIVKFENDDNGNLWIVVSDNGIGMTWETILDYFLTAGASFRKSDAWKQNFSSATGDSQILRSGRFGIGILAAFLLGDIVQVSTRYIYEPKDKGIFFQFGLEDTTIEMKWVSKKHGTTIKIKINKQIIKNLKDVGYYYSKKNHFKWDWFCLDEPKVLRYDENGELLSQEFKLNGPKGNLALGTHRINVSGYEEIHWTYKKSPGLVCNGILISNYLNISLEKEFGGKVYNQNSKIKLDHPKISVFDPDGNLPLNLAREGLASYPKNIAKALADDICKNFIAYCLLQGPQSGLLFDKQFTSYQVSNYPGKYDVSELFFNTLDGFGLVDSWNISPFYNKGPFLIVRGFDQRKTINNDTTSLAKNYKLFYGDSLMALWAVLIIGTDHYQISCMTIIQYSFLSK